MKEFFLPVHMLSVDDGETEQDLRDLLDPLMDDLVSASCTIDGVPVQDIMDYRAASAAFTLPVDEGKLLNQFGVPPGDRTAPHSWASTTEPVSARRL